MLAFHAILRGEQFDFLARHCAYRLAIHPCLVADREVWTHAFTILRTCCWCPRSAGDAGDGAHGLLTCIIYIGGSRGDGGEELGEVQIG